MNIEDLIESNPSPPGRRRPSQQSLPSQQSSLSQPGQPLSEDFRTSPRSCSIQSNPPVLPSPIASHSHAHEGHHAHYGPHYPVRPEQLDQYPGYQQPSHQGGGPPSGRPAAAKVPQPSKKQHHQKWDSDENNLVIQLRGQGMKWADISKRIPGRTELACRLHYQNYLEKRGEWDDEKKDKLTRVYERLKADVWGPVAAELNMPWRAAEAMHWMMGPIEMSRRANTIPFSFVAANSAALLGDGNGCIAQSNRRKGATVCYEACVLAEGERRASTGPVSTFVNPGDEIRGRGVEGGAYAAGRCIEYDPDDDEEDEAAPSVGEGEMTGRQGCPWEGRGGCCPDLRSLRGGCLRGRGRRGWSGGAVGRMRIGGGIGRGGVSSGI